MQRFAVFRRTAAVAAAAAVAAWPAVSPAQTSRPSIDDALAAIAAYAPAAMAYQGTPGLSVAITDRTKTLAVLTLGYANVDAKTPVTPATRFAIGSITKSMTSLAMMQLVDAGTLSLAAPVRQYLPWFSIGGGSAIDVGELLSHTAGIPDDFSSENGWVYNVTALRRANVLFEPGTGWSYSNDGYRDRRRDSREPRPAAVERFRAGPRLRLPRHDEQFARLHAGSNGFGRGRVSMARQRPAGIAPSSARRVAGDGFRRSRRLGALDARGHGALHAPLSERREDRERNAVDFAGGV